MSRKEMIDRGWNELDILLITGDAYVDHPSFATALIGRVLEAEGYRVGIIAQPDWHDPQSIQTMGRPRLFCGISAGNMDSMVANYTASKHKRTEDAYTENGKYGRRPNRAVMIYTQLARRAFKGLPVVIGGIEASMRRTVHYDYWQDKVRPSILADSKADILVYGMGEAPVIKIARRLAEGKHDLSGIPSTARLLGSKASRDLETDDCVILPSYENCLEQKHALLRLTKRVEKEQNPFCARPLIQYHGDRALRMEPPQKPMAPDTLDRIYNLNFTNRPHPTYKGKIPAYDMIRNSITVVRGCPGGCSFCGVGLHQGRFLTSRSQESILRELDRLTTMDSFRGTVTDLGGPTANFYGCHNGLKEACQECHRPSCLFPDICRHFEVQEEPAIKVLREARSHSKVKHLFISSGIRMEVALHTPAYLREIIQHHVSGHLKVAPEHLHPDTLRRMRKPASKVFERFRDLFDRESRKAGKEQYLVPYFISGFPGCTPEEMKSVECFVKEENWKIQQVQDFIPLPMTAAAAMYYTGLDYSTEEPIFVARGTAARQAQRNSLQPFQKRNQGRRRRTQDRHSKP